MQAYWIGNELCHEVTVSDWGCSGRAAAGPSPCASSASATSVGGPCSSGLGDELLIEGPVVTWESGGLVLGPSERRLVWLDPLELRVLGRVIDRGSVVAVHWEEVVDVLDHRQLGWLEAMPRSRVSVANRADVALIWVSTQIRVLGPWSKGRVPDQDRMYERSTGGDGSASPTADR